jgi:F-type H+-transporting ATPase subunit delta
MAKKANPRRYAQAVFEIALGKNETERWQADLQKMAAAVSEGDWLAALESPRINYADKARLLKEKLGDGINPLALNLALLLVTKSGIGMINEITAEYRALLDAYHGVKAADVITALPLDDKETEQLAEKLGKLVEAKVTVKAKTDPDILGGVIARVGGKLLDGSTRTRLNALKKELAGGHLN